MTEETRNDYDSPWKEAISRYFSPFLEFFFPAIHAQIDWSHGYQLLDKEFQQVVREAEVGRRHADMLLRVVASGGAEAWVLVHVEVQSQVDPDFAERMFVYHYRIYDRHRAAGGPDIVSLAILGDTDPAWRPQQYRHSYWGCERSLSFPVAKLWNIGSSIRQPQNPFAWLGAAHLAAQRHRNDSTERLSEKFKLFRGLFGCGMDSEDVRELCRLVDWILALTPELDRVFQDQLDRLEEESQVKYIPSYERKSHDEGHREGLIKGLRLTLLARFGDAGAALAARLTASSQPQLDRLEACILTATLSEMEQLLDTAT